MIFVPSPHSLADRVALKRGAGENRCVNSSRTSQDPADFSPFSPGSMVVLTLVNPREKFWGAILSLAPEGLTLRGTELASFEDVVNIIKDGEPFTCGVVFFVASDCNHWDSYQPVTSNARQFRQISF